jgi:hypothetical protein
MAIIARSYESMPRDQVPTRGEVKIPITTYGNWQEQNLMNNSSNWPIFNQTNYRMCTLTQIQLIRPPCVLIDVFPDRHKLISASRLIQITLP